jgi:hypothetical protein
MAAAHFVTLFKKRLDVNLRSIFPFVADYFTPLFMFENYFMDLVSLFTSVRFFTFKRLLSYKPFDRQGYVVVVKFLSYFFLLDYFGFEGDLPFV